MKAEHARWMRDATVTVAREGSRYSLGPASMSRRRAGWAGNLVSRLGANGTLPRAWKGQSCAFELETRLPATGEVATQGAVLRSTLASVGGVLDGKYSLPDQPLSPVLKTRGVGLKVGGPAIERDRS